MRQIIATLIYFTVVDLLTLSLIVSPVHAITSSTGYVSVIPAATAAAYAASNKTLVATSLGGLAASSGLSTIAARLVTGPTGWAALGITAGLGVLQYYYSQPDTQAIRDNNVGNGEMRNGLNQPMPFTTLTSTSCTSGANCAPNTQFGKYPDPNAYPYCGYYWVAPPAPAGWTVIVGTKTGVNPTTGCTTCCEYTYRNSNAVGIQNAVPGYFGAAFAAALAAYLAGLSDTHPLSPNYHKQPEGQGVTPVEPDGKTTIPVSPTDMPPQVVPIANVKPGDIIMNVDASQTTNITNNTTQNTTTTNTTTTTSTTSGGVTTTTETKQDSATVSCTSGQHDGRTFGTVLQGHMSMWQSTGLLSALGLLQHLTWPSDLPVFTLQSSVMGGQQFTVDFTQWAGMVTALRFIMIAIAGFVAYRIVFVGSK